MMKGFAPDSNFESDSDEEIQEALAAGKIQPGLIVEAQKKNFIDNKEGLSDKIREFSLDKMKWIERLELTNNPAPSIDALTSEGNEDDDFNREMRFYRQAQASVLEGLARLAKLSVPTKRPEDYFAEMAKSDEHMKKVRSKLLEKKMSMERSEKAKKLRELRKYGKKVQHEVLLKRQKEKREMLDSVKKFRKGQIDKIELLGETVERETPAQQTQNGKKNMRPNKKREFKNKKFGFGGQKKRSKYNTAESSADVSDFNARKAHGKGPARKGKGNQRPGKNRRKVLKNKNKH
ncbi:probable rRNA-processing protein EBP2 [Aplysia californica]|uniref:Probable rRNA-processing protein EBP2 n=1 Tax=Aplysia californica TaxID=6500 RepID=A0ABM0K7N8_APLCA|nr:probable rRNA-processing protein EBP2 [Aplysia californica]